MEGYKQDIQNPYFNSVVTMNMKEFGKVHVLWMVCAFTTTIKGIILQDEMAQSVIKSFHWGSCLNYRYPTVGFYADNGGKLKNYKMEEFTNNLSLKDKFGPAFSPRSNIINDRNHYRMSRRNAKRRNAKETERQATERQATERQGDITPRRHYAK